jgi:hypothetical protein
MVIVPAGLANATLVIDNVVLWLTTPPLFLYEACAPDSIPAANSPRDRIQNAFTMGLQLVE